MDLKTTTITRLPARPKQAKQARGTKSSSRGRRRRRASAASPWAVVARQIPIFPVRTERKHMMYYEYSLSINPSVGQIGMYYFSCNGMFDPNISGTGHQPMGFDQMMLFYEQGTVLRSTISVTGTAQKVSRFGVYIAPDTAGNGVDPVKLVENGLMKAHVLDAAAGGGGTGQRQKTVTAHFDAARYFGRRGDIVNDPQLLFTAAANPVEQAYFAVCAWNPIAVAADTTVDFDVLISYDVVFWEPRKLALS